MYSKDAFADNRDYYVLLQSPELYNKYNDQRDALSKQLNNKFPTQKRKGRSPEEIEENKVVQNILRPDKGDEVHHKNALSLIGVMLENADDAGKEAIFNVLEHNGISIGNDAYNLLNLDQKSHDDLHAFAQEQGLEIQGREGKGSKGLAARAVNSRDINTTLEVLQDYIDYGIPLLTEEQDRLLQEAENRKAGQVPAHLINKNIDKFANEIGQDYLNKAGEDVQSTGSIVGQKPFVINADEGANVYVHTNGNGNGENHAIMQEKFNRRRR